MATFYAGNVSVFSVGGVDLICEATNVTYEGSATLVDGSCLTQFDETPQEVKKEGRLSWTNMSTVSGVDRVSHFDLSSLLVDGSSGYLAQIRNVNFSQEYQHENIAGIGEEWRRTQIVKRMVTIEVEADCTTDGLAQKIMTDFHSGTYANRDIDFSFTINGYTITLPTRLESVSYSVQRAGLQTLNFTLRGKAPNSGALFTAPASGTSTILAKSILDPLTALTCNFTPSTDNFALSGSFLIENMSIAVQDEELVLESYTYRSIGAVTATAN